MVCVLSNAGDHVPVIPLLDIVGSGFNVSPSHIEVTRSNVGITKLDSRPYTRTWPESSPFIPSLKGAPTANTEPSALRLTERPERSSNPSPSISDPICVQLLFWFSNTLALPESILFTPSLWVAPMAKILPLLLILNEVPDEESSLFPSILPPICDHTLDWYSKTLTWPIPELAFSDPIATIVPLEFKSTEKPQSSPAVSPTIFDPNCIQLPPWFSNILTNPGSKFWIAPTAKIEPLSLRRTEWPNLSPSPSPPSILLPICIQFPLRFS